jgi:PAS domain S-box-containing protein
MTSSPPAALGQRKTSLGFLLAYAAFSFVSYPFVHDWFQSTLKDATFAGLPATLSADAGYILLTLALIGLLVQRTAEMMAAYERALQASETRLRNVIESTSDWVWEMDAAFGYTFCNARVGDILGYSPESLLGKTPFDFMSSAAVESARAQLSDAAAEQRRLNLTEMTFLHHDGRPVHIEASGVPIVVNGVFRGMRGMNRDVTERMLAQAALRERDERYRTLFSNMREGMALFTLVHNEQGEAEDYIIRDVNPAFEKLLGVNRVDIIGYRATHLHRLLGVLAEEPVMKMLTRQDPRDADTPIEIALPDQQKHLLISSLPLVNGQSGVLVTDFTERRLANEALVRTSVYYRILFDEFPLPTWRSDSMGRIVYVNTALKHLVGDALQGGAIWADLVHADDLAAWEEHYLAATGTHERFCISYRLCTKEGSYVQVSQVGQPLFDPDGDFIGFIGYLE